MRVLMIAGLLGLAMSASAQAACVVVPDTSTSGAANGTQRTVCLQQEMADRMALRQDIQTQTDAAMGQLQLDMKLQEMQQQLRAAPPSFGTP